MNLSKVIREHRIKKGLSPEEIAERVCIPKDTYMQYEESTVTMGIKTFLIIAWELEIDIAMIQKQIQEEQKEEELKKKQKYEELLSFLNELEEFPVLSEFEELIALQGDAQAKRTLAASYGKVVREKVEKYKDIGPTERELVEAGNRGLLKVIKVFKHKVPFNAMARFWIENEMVDAISVYLKNIHCSSDDSDIIAYKVRTMQDILANQKGKLSTPQNVADYLEMDIEIVEKYFL